MAVIDMAQVGADINTRLKTVEKNKAEAGALGALAALDEVAASNLAKQIALGAVAEGTHRQVGQATAPNAAAFSTYTGVIGQIVWNLETHDFHVLDGTANTAGYLIPCKASNDKAYLAIKGKAESAKSADSVAWTKVSGRPDPIEKTGSRGSLAGFQTVSTLTGSPTVTSESGDVCVLNSSGAVTLTFTPAEATVACTKVIDITATADTTLAIAGASWANGEDAPTWGTAGKHLTIEAHFIAGRVDLFVVNNDE